jgi:aminomethyltransferase
MTETAAPAALRRTPFYDIHVALGGKIVPFAGYEMPVQYPTGITAEHKAVRERCGLFDVSHMGEFVVRGSQMVEFVNYVTTNDVGALVDGQVHYSTILYENGTIVDDCLVYKFADRIVVVVNASNREKDFAHFQQYASKFDVQLADISDDIALLALQGPQAAKILQPHADVDLSTIKYYHHSWGHVGGMHCLISRTGYTGEDGFELYCRDRDTVPLWRAITAAGATPIGLGARDSLRLEMGYALYDNEIDDTTTPLEAGLCWIGKLDKGAPFTGADALRAQKQHGITRRLVGFRLEGRGFPRHGYPVHAEGREVDIVRSGTMSPSLGAGIGTTYLPVAIAKAGTKFEVDCRGEKIPAEVVRMPFWTKGSARKGR